ncbi:uncharacterized protein [Montipora foliosa]|uniref:uncharacterized protein n=1 Tax=Montipora foliosa TaxID=591990 RepID=UPI0035F20B04
MTAVIESSHRPRKKLPDIPPEELALHGKVDSVKGSQHHELPPEVQAQFIKHVHRRSHSLTGLDTVEFERRQESDAEKESVESASNQSIKADEELPAFAKSLPATPVSSRKLTSSSLKTTQEKAELMNELRWHYKKFVRTSKRKKEKQVDADANEEDKVPKASQTGYDAVVRLEASPLNSDSSVIHTNRCNQPKCGKTVDILECVTVENHVFHKSCFVCAICNSWLNHFNYCFVPDHDKFYCMQHYQDIENASFGLGEDIPQAVGIGPGVQQQFKFMPDAVDSPKQAIKEDKRVQNSIRVMKEKISLLNKRGKKLFKKENKLKSSLDKFKGTDMERKALWLEWFSIAQEKNSTVRRETELSFKVREMELAEKYTTLEKKLRELSEKDENSKTEYDKSKEKELLQEMLEVVEKREQLISDMEDKKKLYVEEDNALEKEKRKAGFNEPDVIREATAASKDAKKVTEVVKQAPSVVKQSDLCCVLF